MLTATFSLMVIRHPADPRRFVLVDEGPRGWWLPGGGVDGHETFEAGGRREAFEEAGCTVEDHLSLLRLEITPPKIRYILSGRAKSETLKQMQDEHSHGARWMTYAETLRVAQGDFPVANCGLRGDEPLQWFSFMDKGGKGFPLNDDFLETKLEQGTMGMQAGKRSIFNTNATCVIACKVEESDEFIVGSTTTTGGPRLPRFTPDFEYGESMRECAESGVKVISKRKGELKGVLCIRDSRNTDNTLDLQVAFLGHTQAGQFKTAKSDEFVDEFDRRAISRAMAQKIAPLSIIETDSD